jgi:hypothetical protein
MLIIVQFSPLSCYLLYLISKYSLQHFVPKPSTYVLKGYLLTYILTDLSPS